MKSLLLASSLMTFFVSPTAAFSAGKSRVFVGTPVHQNRRLVDDCMTHLSSLCTLTESSTVDEAVYMLLDLDVSGAPVINKDTGELLGIVSTFDFLQQEAGDGALLPIQGTLENVHAYLNQAKKICATRVGDLMTPNPVTMHPGDTMRNAAILMNQKKLHRLPIVEKNGRLVGMLTSSDIMVDMVRVVRSLPYAPEDDLVSP